MTHLPGFHLRICATCGYRESARNRHLHVYALFCPMCKADGDFEAAMGRVEWSGQGVKAEVRVGLVRVEELERMKNERKATS